jgi:hypothetical protein
MQRLRLASLLASTVMTAGCADSANAPAVPIVRDLLPATAVLRAEASGMGGDLLVQCTVNTSIRIGSNTDTLDDRIIQRGEGGGDATRSVTHPNGDKVQFWAHTQFESLVFHLIGTDSLQVRSPPAEQETESRFWREFRLFPGTARDADPPNGVIATGTWTCRPMDTPPSSGQYHDPTGTVAGTWVLEHDAAVP